MKGKIQKHFCLLLNLSKPSPKTCIKQKRLALGLESLRFFQFLNQNYQNRFKDDGDIKQFLRKSDDSPMMMLSPPSEPIQTHPNLSEPL